MSRFALFWDITPRIVAIPYRRFGTTYRSRLQGSRNPRKKSVEVIYFATKAWNLTQKMLMAKTERYRIFFVHWGTSKIIHRIVWNPDRPRQNQNKVAVVGVWTLPQYCQLPDQSSRDAARDIWNFSQYYRMFVVFTLRISAEPLMTFYQTLGLRGTLDGKHWHMFNIEKYYFWKPSLDLS
jgi:hypothetical protein